MEGAIETFEPMAAELRNLLGLEAVALPTEVLALARRRADAAAEARREVEAQKALRALAERGMREAEVERKARDLEIARTLAGQCIEEMFDPIEAVTLLSARDDLRRQIASAQAAFDAAGRGFDSSALAIEETETYPVRTEVLREAVLDAEALRDEALERRSQARMALETALGGEGGVAPDQERAALIEALRRVVVNRHGIGTPDRLPIGTPRWARSGTRPGAAVRVAETGRVPLRWR